MMVVTTWTPEVLARALERTRAIGIKEAARELGKSDASLRSAFAHNGIEWRTLPAPAPASAGVPVSGAGSGREEEGGRPAPAPVEGVDWRGARPKASAAGVERRLNIGDVHIPAHSVSALACVYEIIRAVQPHKIIQMGDLVNAQAFSRHDRPSPEIERLDLTMIAARGFIRSVKRAAPGAELIIIRGNHDDWCSRWEAEHPEFQGTFDFEIALGIRSLPDDDRPPMFDGVKVVRHAERHAYVDGPIAYCHGNAGGMHFAKRYAENNGPRTGVRHMRVGHHHSLQTHTHKNGIQCQGVGWLGNEEHPAMRYAPPPVGWWVGVTLDDVFGDHVTSTAIEIRNGLAIFGGRIIAAAA